MRGIFTALATPFGPSGEIDWAAYQALLNDQKDAGVTGVIPCGTTGESPTLTKDEKKRLIETAIQTMKGSSTVVFAGTGSNNTQETVEFSKWASDAGAAGVLIVTPYYNKPTQAGIIAHFNAVADAVSCNVMVYNIPGRTGMAIQPETLAQLARHKRIRYLKESSGSLTVLSDIQDALSRAGTSLEIFCGDDGLFLPMLSIGACGVVSVASNLIPRTLNQLQTLHDTGKGAEARTLHQKLYPLFRDLFIEANPAPLKQAMEWAKRASGDVRLPLVRMKEENISKLRPIVEKLGIVAGAKL